MTKSVNIHATCVRVGNQGVLLIGKSGSGKSDLALRLIANGAKLVSDDRCDMSVEGNRLVARAPKTLAGLLEVRGIGIVPMAHVSRAAIALVVDLSGGVVRMPTVPRYVPPPPLHLRQSAQPRVICLNALEASAADKVAVALRLIGQRGRGGTVKRI